MKTLIAAALCVAGMTGAAFAEDAMATPMATDAMSTPMAAGDMMTVSYTHLDVYKRQP